MRLHITLATDRPIVIPVNYQESTAAAIYSFVSAGDADYGRFVHDEGYLSGGKVFKPYVHSWLRIPARRRRIVGERLHIAPGPIGWTISSPLDTFLEPFASGLLQTGALQLGATTLPIESVEAAATPEITETMTFTCLSPIVASTRRDDGTTQFLRPVDDPAAFSEAIRKNLIAKHQALTGTAPTDDTLSIAFDPAYLADHSGGTKKITYKGIEIIGILAPFTATGSVELMRLGYEAGFGSRGAQGFGCAEVRG